MSPQSLLLLLAEPFSPEMVGQAATLCDEWFAAEPSIPSFTLRAIFSELAGQWDDEQGVPSARFTPFREQLAPSLRQVVNEVVEGAPAKAVNDSLETLVRIFRDCRLAGGY